ncbi:MAG: flippase-like domain-containing protein, partial [Bacteroidales bacterium]|nr:flippase-like domain-containing protein [Bacteroidales bacterium]
MDVKVKEILKYTISAAVAGVLLYFSFREVKWEDFIQGLEQCRWGYVLLSMLAGVLAFWLRAVRWRRLIVPIDPDTGMLTVFNAVNIGYISNFVVPRIGEFVRCGVVSRNSEGRRASYEAVLGTVVLERAWDLVSMLILLVVLLVARMDMFGDFFVEKMLGPLSEKLNFSLWWILFCGLAVASAGVWGIWLLHDKNVFCGKIWNFFAGLLQGLASCLK